MKYLKYFEARHGAPNQVDTSTIIEKFNNKLNILGISAVKDASTTAGVKILFNLDFTKTNYSILHISTLFFKSKDRDNTVGFIISEATPNFDDGAINMVKTLTYHLSKGFRPFTNESIYNHFYERLMDKWQHFNNTAEAKGLSFGSTPQTIEYNSKNFDCKQVVLDYLEANKAYNNEVIIPQSSIDMTKKIIESFGNNHNIQHQIINGLKKNNPKLYQKITNEDIDKASDMVDMGFSD